MTSYRDWQLTAAGQQQTFYNQFGDRRWDLIRRQDASTLSTKISYALYAKPFSDLTTEKIRSLEKTKTKLLQLSGSGDVHLGCVFVSVLPKESREPNIVPLIRTKQTYGDDEFFVEEQPGRVYTGWTDFVENNKLLECDMCYPRNGHYEARFNGRVSVEFRRSPSCNGLFKTFDFVSVVGKVASSSLLAATVFFPIMTPITIGAAAMLGTTTAYSTTRSITGLVDRNAHHQSIGLENGNARGLWIGMGADIIGSVLVGGAAALPRLVASGRLAANITSGLVEVLSWASIGVNGFGVLANITELIIRYRDGTLQARDIQYFISSCIFIGNIVLNTVLADRIIRSLSNQPSQICSFLKMTSNTAFNPVKMIVPHISFEGAIEMICGVTFASFLRHFNMRHTAAVLETVGNTLRRFRRGTINVSLLISDLFRLMRNHLIQFCTEIGEAWKTMRTYAIRINGLRLFEAPQLHSREVIHSVDRVLDNIDIHEPEVRNSSRDHLINLATKLGRNMNVQNEREYASACQILMNDIMAKCDQKMVVSTSDQGFLQLMNRRLILQEVMQEFGDEFDGEPAPSQTNRDNMQESNEQLCLQTFHNGEDMNLFTFVISYKTAEFDQFIHDAACQLLNEDDFLTYSRINVDNERVIVIECHGKTLIFHYQPLTDSDSAVGFATLRE